MSIQRTHRARLLLLTVCVLVAVGCRSDGTTAARDDNGSQVAATTTTLPPPPPPKRFTLTASGDVLIHEGLAIRASRNAGGGGNASGGPYDFKPMFEKIRPVISAADLSICHMEVPISARNRDLAYYPRFHVPREVAEGIAYAGFDMCTTASNHAIDKGTEALFGTLDVLDANKLGHSGTGRTPEETKRPATYNLNGLDVAVLSYTFSLNGLKPPAGQEWVVNMIDPDRILSDAQAAKAAGAEFVTVNLHWGTEYDSNPNEQQKRVAQQLLSTPHVDLLLGHHTHVVQPITKVGEKFAVYGMGNFISRQNSSCCPAPTQDGLTVHFVIEEIPGGAAVTQLTYTPTWVEQQGLTVLSVAQALDDPATPRAYIDGLRTSWRRTTTAVNAL